MTQRFDPRPLRGLLPVCVLLLLSPAEAQEVGVPLGPMVLGVVMDGVTGAPLTAGSVSLLDTDGKLLQGVLIDEEGRYAIRAPGPGSYRLRAQGIGYHPREGGPFPLEAGDTLAVDFQLLPSPIPMDSILVSVRRQSAPVKAGQQLIYGRLLEDGSGAPIPQGVVSLVRESGRAASTLTGDDGLFWLVSPVAGTYRLKAERIGYETSTGPEFHLMPGDSIGVDFYLSVEAVLLNPLVVRATARAWTDRRSLFGMESFLQRLSRFGESGFGTFLTRDGIAEYDGRMTTTRMLMSTVMEARAVNTGGGIMLRQGCNPRYYLDGTEYVRGDPSLTPLVGTPASTPLSQGVDPELLYPPETLEAVEVYVAPSIPAEFSQGFPCGVVALWTRRPRDRTAPVTSWKTLLTIGGVVALGLWIAF